MAVLMMIAIRKVFLISVVVDEAELGVVSPCLKVVGPFDVSVSASVSAYSRLRLSRSLFSPRPFAVPDSTHFLPIAL